MRRSPILVLLVLAFALTACSSQPPEVEPNDQVPAAQALEDHGDEAGEAAEAGPEADFATADAVWVAEGLAYTSAPTTVAAGEVVLGMEVIGGLPHNVVFEGFEGDRRLVDGPGAGTFAEVVNLPPGEYTYYCDIAGHRAAGMEGTITVE